MNKFMTFDKYRVFETEFAGRPLKVETGKMTQLANGACLVTYGDTTVHCAVTASAKPREGVDFFPLSVKNEWGEWWLAVCTLEALAALICMAYAFAIRNKQPGMRFHRLHRYERRPRLSAGGYRHDRRFHRYFYFRHSVERSYFGLLCRHG